MKFLLPMIFAMTLALAWQSAALADSQGKATEAAAEATDKGAETAKDAGEKKMKKKKKDGEEDPDCE